MFEHRSEPLLSRRRFLGRLARVFLLMASVVALSAFVGTLGYRAIAGFEWSDAFHHACLVLGEHPHEKQLKTTPGKVFAGLYVMYARLVFFSVVAILILPVLHRILHKLHLDATVTDSNDPAEDVK